MNSLPKIEVDFDLTFGETYRAVFRMLLSALKYLILLVCLAVLTFLICLFIYNSNSSWRLGAEAVAEWLYPFLVGAVPTTIVMIPFVSLVRVWIIRRTPSVSGKRRYTFSDEGIKIEFDSATSELKWPFYTRIKETAAFFLLYVTGSFCNIVPKRSFVDSAQLDSFRSLVRARARKYNLKK
jgi:hypothetical protein